MINRYLMLITLILVPIAVISFKKVETNFNLPKNEDKKLIVKLKDAKENISTLELEDYVVGVVAAEMPASFELEALKAQAVAARTYAVYKMNNNREYDLVIGTSDQSYITEEEMKNKWSNDYDKYYSKVVTAVTDTKNEVIKYDNQVIQSFYFSMSNGYTENSSFVFGEKPYLESVESSWDNSTLSNFSVQKEYTRKEFCSLLNITCEDISISDINLSESNRIYSLKINDKKYLGTELRKKLNLRSTDFKIEINNKNIIITTEGYGHGVGMSQYGANGMAKEGYSYKEILTHYYTDTKISQL